MLMVNVKMLWLNFVEIVNILHIIILSIAEQERKEYEVEANKSVTSTRTYKKVYNLMFYIL